MKTLRASRPSQSLEQGRRGSQSDNSFTNATVAKNWTMEMNGSIAYNRSCNLRMPMDYFTNDTVTCSMLHMIFRPNQDMFLLALSCWWGPPFPRWKIWAVQLFTAVLRRLASIPLHNKCNTVCQQQCSLSSSSQLFPSLPIVSFE